MILEKLKALWALPTLLMNESHATQSALDRLTFALQRTPPAFVLVLLQGQDENGAPFVAAMSGELQGTGGALRLRYDVTGVVKAFTLLVFCDLQRVRIASMSAANFQLAVSSRAHDTSAPMAYHDHELRPGNAVIVELEAR
jgi:hypothetical protein